MDKEFVFPAQAGMNRGRRCPALREAGVPRTGGDEPEVSLILSTGARCSPHRRG